VPLPPAAVPTRILVLRNMCTRDELANDQDFAEITEDVQEECSRFGAVSSVAAPRPGAAGGADPPGVGLIFVEYGDAAHAVAAAGALGGRKFGGHVVEAAFLSEQKWAAKDFS